MRRLLRQTRLLVAVLLIAALTLLPVVDAMACAFEPATTSAQAADAGNAGDAGDAGAKDHLPGVCEHNHCHHCSANVLPDVASAPGSRLPRQLLPRHPHTLALSERVDSLMRPPRN